MSNTTGSLGAESQDLVLAPETYAYTQAANNGSIRVHVGATAVPLSGQEKPVRFDPNNETFVRCNQTEAVQKNAKAGEGDYLILTNPSDKGEAPSPDGARTPPVLLNGRRVNVPGPKSIALWPGQKAQTVKGHQLRSNQYLIVRVYNEDEARQNWSKSIFRRIAKLKEQPSTPTGTNGTSSSNLTAGKETIPGITVPVIVSQLSPKGETSQTVSTAQVNSSAQNQSVVDTSIIPALSMGALLIIRGTEVSFYIPPTGIEVVQDSEGNYVRDAVTLEQLEYCILVDENGIKRYERGPSVVFPEPTEQFISNDNARKFRAIELNAIQGLHIKVISNYEENGRNYQTGEELFITGKDTAIYYPRVEHAIIRYGDHDKHFSTAIPAGEARYVMNRMTGEIKKIDGPRMLLPNPINEIIVRRVLSQKQVSLWYPGNSEALAYNASLEDSLREIGGSTNAVEESLYRSARSLGSRDAAAKGFSSTSYMVGASGSARESAGSAHIADTMNRGSSYSKPRMITLDTKYDSVPSINIWTGYAVMIVDKQGHRRVAVGPTSVLLAYDETLEVLELSTGKPKTTDKTEKTVYLRITNNKVSDIIDVETNDHVRAQVKISMRVNFGGEDPLKWFSVENYVKLLTDHVRSVLKGSIKKYKIETFYAEYVDIIRNVILGEVSAASKNRPGMTFQENGMTVTDVEVLDCTISDSRIRTLLEQSQHDVVKNNIDISNAERQINMIETTQEYEQRRLTALHETEERKRQLEQSRIEQILAVAMAECESEIKQKEERQKVVAVEEETRNQQNIHQLAREKSVAAQREEIAKTTQNREIERLNADVDAIIKRFAACQGQFSETLLALNRDEIITKIAQATSVQRLIGGDSIVDVLKKILSGTPLETVMDKLGQGFDRNNNLNGSRLPANSSH